MLYITFHYSLTSRWQQPICNTVGLIPQTSYLPIAVVIWQLRKAWLLCNHSARLHGSKLRNANRNIIVTLCKVSVWHLERLQAWNPVYRASVDPRAMKGDLLWSWGPHLVVYENKLVLNLLYLEQITRRLLPDAVHQGETGPLCLGGMGQIHSPHFSH